MFVNTKSLILSLQTSSDTNLNILKVAKIVDPRFGQCICVELMEGQKEIWKVISAKRF